MARIFQPARLPGGGAPTVLWKPYTDGESFLAGAIMIEDTATQGSVKEGATDVTADIHGIAMDPDDSRPGFELGHASQVTQVTNRVQEVGLYVADATTVFSGETYSGTSATAALANMVDLEFGLRVLASGVWVIDTAETSSVAIKMFDVNVDENIAYFRFLVAALPVGV